MTENNWRETTLGEFVRLQRGHDLPERERRPGAVPIMGSAGINGFHDTPKAKGPGVVIGRSGVGSMGVVTYCPVDYWPHNTVLYVTDFLGNDERFVYYFLCHLNLRRFDSGSAQASLNRNYVYPTRVFVPHLKEQRAIAHILGTLDDKIELNRQMNETLKAIARALFKSWFVDFDPVRAKAEGRDPSLPKPLADLFPDSFEESRLGKIPKGWRVGTLNDVAEVNAKTLGRTDALEVIDYIEINEVMRGEIGSVVRYERGAEPSRARRRLRHGDSVLSTVRPDRGAYFLCLNPPRTLIASTGFAVLSPRDGNWAFLYSALTRHEVGEELSRLADGGAYPAVRPEAIAARGFVIPKGSQIVSAFQKLAGPWFERAQQNRAEGESLGALRDALLPKLLSGGLRVKDAERIVAAQV